MNWLWAIPYVVVGVFVAALGNKYGKSDDDFEEIMLAVIAWPAALTIIAIAGVLRGLYTAVVRLSKKLP